MDKNGIAKRYAVAIYDIAKSMSNIEEIRDQISTFITDAAHAIYLGTELHKAELALKNGLKYIRNPLRKS